MFALSQYFDPAGTTGTALATIGYSRRRFPLHINGRVECWMRSAQRPRAGHGQRRLSTRPKSIKLSASLSLHLAHSARRITVERSAFVMHDLVRAVAARGTGNGIVRVGSGSALLWGQHAAMVDCASG
jgi:hypothetical protein